MSLLELVLELGGAAPAPKAASTVAVNGSS